MQRDFTYIDDIAEKALCAYWGRIAAPTPSWQRPARPQCSYASTASTTSATTSVELTFIQTIETATGRSQKNCCPCKTAMWSPPADIRSPQARVGIKTPLMKALPAGPPGTKAYAGHELPPPKWCFTELAARPSSRWSSLSRPLLAEDFVMTPP